MDPNPLVHGCIHGPLDPDWGEHPAITSHKAEEHGLLGKFAAGHVPLGRVHTLGIGGSDPVVPTVDMLVNMEILRVTEDEDLASSIPFQPVQHFLALGLPPFPLNRSQLLTGDSCE